MVAVFSSLYGGYAGATGAWLIGEATEANEAAHTSQGVLPGGWLGSSAGLGIGLLVGHHSTISPEGGAQLYTDTLLGTYWGDLAGRALIPVTAPGAVERTRAAGLAGSMAGVATAIIARDHAAPLPSQGNLALATGAGWLTGRGIGQAAGWDEREDRQRIAAAQGAASATLGGLALYANHQQLTTPTPASAMLTFGDGIWFGAWTPFLFTDNPTPEQTMGGTQVGLGCAYAAGVTAAALGQPSDKSVAMQAAGLTAGSSLGAGIPMSLSATGPMRGFVGPMLATGLGGQVLGGVLAPHYEVDSNDALLMVAMESWTTWQALGWSTFALETGTTGSQAAGYGLTAGGAGTLATMALLPIMNVTPEGSTMLVSGGAWGSWFGAWGSQLADASPDALWVTSLTAGDAAMLATGLTQAAGWQPEWRDAALINGLGVLGTAAGGLFGAVALYNPDDWTPVSTALLAGSGAGLVTGAALAARHPTHRQTPRASKAVTSPASRSGLASTWERLPVHANIQAQPWSSGDGQPGLWLQLDLTEKDKR